MIRMLCCAAALAASGCTIISYHGGGDGIPCGRDDHDHGGPQPCASERDCREGDACVDNLCRVICNSDAACGEGHRCFLGLCEGADQHPKCETHADCAADRVCEDGSCLQRCSDATDCDGFSDACGGGVCTPPGAPGSQEDGDSSTTGPTSCAASCQCPTGQECVEGKCATPAPQPEPRLCQVDCECPSGEKCVNGACG